MIKQKKRSEIDNKYKWDLSKIYSSKEEIEKDFKEASKLSKKISKYESVKINSAKDLYDLLELDIKLDRILNKLMLYSELKVSEEGVKSSNQELYGKVMNLVTLINSEISFMDNKILKIEDEKMKEFLGDNILKDYKFYLKNLVKDKKHTLSDENEKLLSSLSKSLSICSDLYDTLVDVDMKFGTIENEKGEKIELTNSNYSLLAKSKDRKIREKAFKLLYGTYGKYTNTISSIYNSHLETNTILSNLRKYKSVLEEELSSDNLKIEIYENLINTVNKNLKSLHKFYKVKKDSLNYKELHIYDISYENKNKEKTYTFEEAKDIILDTFSIMGEDYVSILKKAFDENWIDVYNNVGKRSGAFSAGIYDATPYVLTNYEGKISDISTLAHELGHAVNTYFSKNNNFYLYYDTSLFVAEIASLTNEIIFNKKMIEKETDIKAKQNILNDLIRLFNSNLFDACLGAEFEIDVHTKVQDKNVLTSEYFNEFYLKLNKKYYGKDVIVDDEIKYRWEIFSHLFIDYYLFKYAIGISIASYCADKILNKDEEFIKKYKEFLKIGSSKYPRDAIKTLGIDIENPEFIENAIKFYDSLVKEYEKLIKR